MTSRSIPEHLNTRDAAKALMRQEATLRRWAFTRTGPVQPVRINGRLAWPADQIATLLSPSVSDEIADGSLRARVADLLRAQKPEALARLLRNASAEDRALAESLLGKPLHSIKDAGDGADE